MPASLDLTGDSRVLELTIFGRVVYVWNRQDETKVIRQTVIVLQCIVPRYSKRMFRIVHCTSAGRYHVRADNSRGCGLAQSRFGTPELENWQLPFHHFRASTVHCASLGIAQHRHVDQSGSSGLLELPQTYSAYCPNTASFGVCPACRVLHLVHRLGRKGDPSCQCATKVIEARSK